LHALSGLGLLLAVIGLLPHLLPGAMCAAGVLDAFAPLRSALVLRFAAMAVFAFWAPLGRWQHRCQSPPLNLTQARALLLALAVAAAASLQTGAALWAFEPGRRADCCGELQALARGTWSLLAVPMLGAPAELLLLVAACGAMVAMAWASAPRSVSALSGARFRKVCGAMALFAVLFCYAAARVLVSVTGPAVYGTASHRCPWCLFLPQHQSYGLWPWAMLLGVVRECAVILANRVALQRAPGLGRPIQRASRLAAVRLTAWAALLVGLAIAPPLSWRLHAGSWMLLGAP